MVMTYDYENLVSNNLLFYCMKEEVKFQEKNVTFPESHIDATGRSSYCTFQYFKTLTMV